MPQHQRVLAGLLVIIASDAFDAEPEALIEAPGRFVRLPYFERGALRPGCHDVAKDFLEKELPWVPTGALT